MAELRRILEGNDPKEIAALFEDFCVDVVDETHILRLAVALGSTVAVRILCSGPYNVEIPNDCMTHVREVSRNEAMIACLKDCGWKPPVGVDQRSLRLLHHRGKFEGAAAAHATRVRVAHMVQATQATHTVQATHSGT